MQFVPTAGLHTWKGGMNVIDVKEAVKTARQFLGSLYDGKADHVRLEEVELTDAPDLWHVTLSFLLPGVDEETIHMLERVTNPLARPSLPRHYKVFIVDQTGSVRAMKIRKMP